MCVGWAQCWCSISGDLEQTSSFYAQGGLAAAFDSDDSPLQHMTDTIMAGDGLCDTGVVQGYCSAAPAFVRRLIDLGVPFDQTSDGHFRLAKGMLILQLEFFHVKDYTGTAIIRVLYQQLQSYSNVTWLNFLAGFLTCSDSKRVVGVRVDDRQWFFFSHRISYWWVFQYFFFIDKP